MKELVYKLKDKVMENYLQPSIESYRKRLENKHERQKQGESVKQYFTARPNPGAGIGHQFANWTAGYWFAKLFGLEYAYLPFSNSRIPYSRSDWDEFFGFGANELSVEDLIKKEKYRIVRLPLFDEHNKVHIELIKKIITAYFGRRIIFLAAQDQFYFRQYDLIPVLQHKFYTAAARGKDHCIYDQEECSIAVHIRRGDIMQTGQGIPNRSLAKRYQNNQYYITVLEHIFKHIPQDKKARIYLFSQGREEEFQDFLVFRNIEFCLEMDAMSSFLHLVYADILITSKSSFSYKAALINQGIKYCPREFWHGYPREDNWILADDNGKVVTASE